MASLFQDDVSDSPVLPVHEEDRDPTVYRQERQMFHDEASSI